MARGLDASEGVHNNNNCDRPRLHVPGLGLCSFCGKRGISQEESRRNQEKEKKRNDNGIYLSIILGNNIDLRMSSTDRFLYKKDYENFKLRVTLLNMVVLFLAFLFPSRPFDMICHFLMVWYYCTLTIRESILIINGSQMHWWWVAHHYIATVLGGVAVTWPDDQHYADFRPQFLLFTGYICLVQQMQYQYQNGCLRRLHALGHGDHMDITLEGFASWMFHGLTFLLPLLIVAYSLELYNAYTLFTMWMTGTTTWHVPVLSALFFVFGNGNIIMVMIIVSRKYREDKDQRKKSIIKKYPSMNKMDKLN